MQLLRRITWRLILLLEGGEFFSDTARELLEQFHGVRVGAYSYGPCMVPGEFPSGVTVGRYTSIASGVRVFVRNHPLDTVSTHAFFFNSALGFVAKDTIETGQLDIGHDVWIGANAIITPGCKKIGIGAVVGAGSVVTKDVLPFAIVGGNPVRVIRFRFEESRRRAILGSQWWDQEIADLVPLREGAPFQLVPNTARARESTHDSPRSKTQRR